MTFASSIRSCYEAETRRRCVHEVVDTGDRKAYRNSRFRHRFVIASAGLMESEWRV